ncbi:MAG TPA: hypothetical protein ENG96_04510 [Gammaproteobacteria bacterium]|nr:hypothetical protein [Gammaproteobacteria bacterium]
MMMYQLSKNTHLLALLVMTTGLCACGGSSSGDDSGSGIDPWNLNPDIVFVSGDEGEVSFNTLTPGSIEKLVTGNYSRNPDKVSGILALPASLTGKVPAIIIAHSSGGISAKYYDLWTPLFTTNGIAAFVIDSYTGRNPPRAPSGQALISNNVQMVDAMVALKLLSTHPDIDPDRIGFIGFSAGAQAVQGTIFDEVRKEFLDASLKFAAYIPVYPVCERRRWSPNMASEPILTLLGELDQLGTAGACVEYNNILSSNGADVTTTIYPGVYHSFDGVGFVTVNDLIEFTQCSGEFRLDTLTKRNYKTGQVFGTFKDYFSYILQCSNTIPNMITLGGTQESLDNSTADVINFLKTVFVLP